MIFSYILYRMGRLDDQWRQILKQAWSIRLMLLAGLLSGLEVALPFFTPDFPRGLAGVISLFVTCAALLARITVQRKF